MNSSAIARLVKHGKNSDPRVVQFREDLVLHERFQDVLDEAAERIQFGGRQSMTAIIGPTGSGKTAVAQEFKYQFDNYASAIPTDRRPSLLYMELASSEVGAFNWKGDFYQPALEILQEPCARSKIDIEKIRAQTLAGNTRQIFSKAPATNRDYRNLLYDALDRARTLAFLIDEADHFRRPMSKDGVFRQYNNIKSRSNSCDTHFVLLGTTDIRDIFRQSGQISRRVYPVWLSPYSRAEISAFTAAAAALVEKLPIPVNFSVASKIEDLLDGTFGLFGILYEWFERALIKCLAQNKGRLTWAIMCEERLHEMQLDGILTELINFQIFEREIKAFIQQKKTFLFPVNSSADASASSTAKRGTNPGARNPIRDAVPL
ncbi:ATP-binding protein [Polaromonas sp. JS666]|uniref:ATP-binding protein n=1 Tax=Polaromonas sp. (strain JS666 / ATCC BAA-500) TaxID=296591 RepID=UPI0002D7A43A|nr:ATP-binding protein [Polaromonas sp. JS666]